MSAWHLEIRGVDGRVVCQADVEARKISDIDAVKSGDTLGLLLKGDTVAVGYPTIEEAQDGTFELYRWPLNEKGEPKVSKIS